MAFQNHHDQKRIRRIARRTRKQRAFARLEALAQNLGLIVSRRIVKLQAYLWRKGFPCHEHVASLWSRLIPGRRAAD